GLGKTAFVFSALKEGDIDIYPEFTGTVINTQIEEDAVSNDASEVYEQARKGMIEEYDMLLLKPMTINNTYSDDITEDLSSKYNIESICDQHKEVEDLVAGFTLEFKDRQDG